MIFNYLVSAWDYSAWVRTYALFLEERLECFRVLKYDIETERLVRSSFLYVYFDPLHHLCSIFLFHHVHRLCKNY